MSSYTPTFTNAAGTTKDSTHTTISGADIGTEFDNISTAVNSKADTASPTLVTPVLGVATATSINKVTITQPATSAVLTLTDGKTLTVNNTITLAGTDATTITFPTTSATLARTDAANSFTGTQTFLGLVDASGASAGQIKFPATQNASANANTLDDYKEGTFNATIVGTSTAGAGTYTDTLGSYTKIGDTVFFQLYIGWTAHTGTGNMKIGNLPYSCADSAVSGIAGLCISQANLITVTAGNVIGAYMDSTAATASVRQWPTGGGAASDVPLDVAGSLIVSGHYKV